MATQTLRGAGKILKDGKYLSDTGFEIIGQKPRETGGANISGYLSAFNQKALLGLAGEILVLRLSDGAEQEILRLEDIYQKPRWRFRPILPVNPKLDPFR
jgi:hypothetical protein